jgi:hypothetical protein
MSKFPEFEHLRLKRDREFQARMLAAVQKPTQSFKFGCFGEAALMKFYDTDYEPLFQERSLEALLVSQTHRAENLVNELSDDALLSMSTDDLVERLFQDFVPGPLVLDPEGTAHVPRAVTQIRSPRGGIIAVSGYAYQFDFTYTGPTGLWRHKPNTSDLHPPRVILDGGGYEGRILITVVGEELTTEFVRDKVHAEIEKIQRYIDYQALELEPFRDSFRDKMKSTIDTRKESILRARHVAASIGYPLHRSLNAPTTYISPVIRKKIPIERVPAEKFEPEPAMAENEYQNILRIIENMTFVMERSPTVFSRMPEPAIRDHYLVQLNGQYERAV